ncbi:MAG: hypothetical protein HRU28_06975 [Rhizobiales bacterium]|nr:hypothetical protein [Hyphomicrobiales bacterium]
MGYWTEFWSAVILFIILGIIIGYFFKKNWLAILLTVLALPTVSLIYQVPFFVANQEFTEKKLLLIVKRELEKNKFIVAKTLPYTVFSSGYHSILKGHNYEDCGVLCSNLAQNENVNQFYGIYEDDNSNFQTYGLISVINDIKSDVIKIDSDDYYSKNMAAVCYTVEENNYLMSIFNNYKWDNFNFINRYYLCHLDNKLISIVATIDTSNAYFTPWLNILRERPDIGSTNLNWYRIFELLNKEK